MSRCLNLVGALSRTPGNDMAACLALSVAAVALPASAVGLVGEAAQRRERVQREAAGGPVRGR
jgi:hypothetical protein